MSRALTAVFGRADDIHLVADVHYPKKHSATVGGLLWFHGGALLLGGRQDVPPDLLAMADRHGFAVISADYRLAPQVSIDQIANDVELALTWAQTTGATEHGWDGGAIIAAGLSAGGYLALRTGLMSSPPAAIVSWYGYGTLDSPWYTEPSREHEKPAGPISRDEAFATIGSEVVVDGHSRPDAWKYYLYARQVGEWPSLAAGVDYPRERHRLRQHSPTYHIAESFPPALLLHGTDDHDVPHSESAAMAAMLKLHGIDHEFISLDGFDHGLDPGDDPERLAMLREAHRRTQRFMARHLHLPRQTRN